MGKGRSKSGKNEKKPSEMRKESDNINSIVS
jgi:hypothetical protein